MKTYILLLSLFLPMFLMGQTTDEYYYYYNGKRIPLELNRDYVSISSKKVEVSNLPNNVSVQGRPALSEEGNYLREIRIGENITEKTYMDRISLLEKDRDIISILPYFKTKNNDKIGVSNYFFVKLKKDSDEDLLYSFAKSHKCIVVNKNKFMPLWYTLSTTKESFYTSLKIANIFYESNYFEEAEPDLMLDNLILGDNTFENTQWGLDNTGQYGKQKGIDIKAKQAWRISRGKDVKVAVLDQGIELNHPDLKENLSSLSYDTEKGVSPSVLLGEHGTACAGIIGAVDNEIGVIGVAPESKLISISNILRMTLKIKEKLADGINWAWQNGADVISNSWGGEDLRSMFIDDAIKNALTKGRNGKGCVVVFATGNSNNKVLYPANSNPDIIAVGAMSPCGERKNPSSCDKEDWWGSCYGNELDVMAPGVLISTTDISTIDYEGREGYNPHSPLNPPIIPDFDNTDYTNSFGGTSSACPHVAGVAALILSVNPDLTAKQVADIIEQTAQKVGGYNYQNTYTRPNGTWNNEMGYGLVDAYKALQKATIAGPDEFCLKTDATFELIAPIPNDATIKWEDPEYKLEIVSGQGTKSCVFRGTYWDGNRTIKAVVTYKDGTVKSFEKEVYVRYEGNWSQREYTIKNHPQSPYSTPCCNGSTRVIKHVILDDYMGASTKVEWKNTIVYKDPKDNFEFRGTNREEEFVATRYTFTPFIVETKMRYISDCGTPTKWSNTIARYYGAINETSFRSASAYNSPVKSTNEDIPVYEFFTNRASILRVQTEDLQQWLDAKYSGKELNDKELQKVLYYLNNRDNLDKIGVKVFDFSGKRILQGDLDFGKSLDFNMSRYAKGFYIITYEFGSISNGKVIYKP